MNGEVNIPQNPDDPEGYVWIQRAVAITGKSRDWISARCDVMTQARRDYVSISQLKAAVARESQLQPKASDK